MSTDTTVEYRRGLHIPVEEIEERAETVDYGRIWAAVWLAIPYFVCFVVSRILTRLVAACAEGWASGKQPTRRTK